MKEVLFLKPVFKERIWGGDKLSNEFGYKIEGTEPVGECWGISACPQGESVVANGRFKGRTISDLWKNEPGLFANAPYEAFPIMVKIIDAKTDLSIQIHPDDRYAREQEGVPYGKTECWYVLDCEKDSTIVIGHNARTREEFRQMVQENRWSDLIREEPVKKGDFFQINPGTVHAIKGGTLILETQQSSDITYRLYDYDRTDSEGNKRELHIEKCLDVVEIPSIVRRKPSTLSAAVDICRLMGDGRLGESYIVELFSCDYYKIFDIHVGSSLRIKQPFAFMNMSVISGSGEIDEQPVGKGDHFIVPCDYGNINLTGNLEIIASTIP